MTRREFQTPFNQIDLELGEFAADELSAVNQSTGFMEMLAYSENPQSYCQTLYVNGLPWLIGGYYPADEGVIQCFIVPSLESLKKPLTLIRLVIAWIKRIQSLDCHRIQTYSLPIPRIRKWMKTLGFTCEGTLRGYTKTGQNYEVWSIVKADGIWRSVTI